MGRATVFFALLVGAALSACCGNGSDGDPGTIDGEITVFAASSLSEAFKEVGAAFEKANPGTEVTFNFAASSALAVQINEGAPADVFASADTAQMKNVIDQGNAEGSAVFATNTPVVVVPKDGKAVATFADLAKPGVKLVLAGEDVPIGRYAREVLAKASGTGGISPDFSDRVLANLKSEEANVRAVLAKIQLGEADAGVVYRTDIVAAAGDVRVIEIPAPYNVLAEYSIAVVLGSPNGVTAAAFTAFVRSKDGQAILEKYGFAAP